MFRLCDLGLTVCWRPVPLAMRPCCLQQIHAARTRDCPLRRQRHCRYLLTTTVRRFETITCPSCSIAHIAEARCRLPAFPVTRGLPRQVAGRALGKWVEGKRGRGAQKEIRQLVYRTCCSRVLKALKTEDAAPDFQTERGANPTSTPEQVSHDWSGGMDEGEPGLPSTPSRNAGLPDLPGRVVPRWPNGAIREANRGWMKGKALQQAGAAWDVGPHEERKKKKEMYIV